MKRWRHSRWLMVPPAVLVSLAAAALLAMALGLPFGSLSASADEEKPAATPAPEGQTASKLDVQTRTMPLRMDTGNYYEIIEGFEDGWPGIWTVFDNNGTANGEYYWWPKTWEARTGAYKGWPAGGGLNGYNSHTSGGARYAYPNNLASWMVSPAIDLTNAVAGDVSFWMLLDTELNYDYCGVYASLNGNNYYGTGLSGNTGGWRYYDYDIANWPGLGNLLGDSSVWFAWICTSDASITRSAMYLDDIDLQVTLVCDAFGDPHATCYPPMTPLMPFDRTNWPARWAINEALDPDLSCTGPYWDSIWYHFQAPCTGTAEVDTFGSNYDTVLGVFSGGSPGTERACSDDASGLQSQVVFPMTAGVTYHVLAGTFDSGTGGTLRVHGEVRSCEQIADVGIDGQSMLNPPSSIPVNQNVNLTLRKTLHNNGPNGPATVNISTQAIGPGDCTITPPSAPSPSLPVSVNVTVDEVWTVRCSQASTHTFTFNNSIAVVAPWTDPVPGNNSASTQLTTAVTASADVAIAAQSIVNPPSQIQCNQNVQVTLRKDIVNNGPYTPVDVNINTQGVAPTGCTITPPASLAPLKLDVAANAAVDEVWTIRCSEAGNKTFTFNNEISVTTAHVSDPNSGNNTRSTQFPVTVVNCPLIADVGIDGQSMLNPPSSIPVNQNVNLTLRKTLHNNGPNGPATVNISTQAIGPGDCTITPPSAPSPSLPVSVNVTVDEVWTVRCSQASTHTFTFNNSIAVGAGWTDPVPGNNSASTQLTTAVTASADVAIAAQSVVNPPSQIQCDQNVQVTLRKDIVNNGPYSPVDVNINTQGVAPTGCTITPPASLAPLKLDVAANAAVDEVWTIRCSQEGSKTFTFNNEISVTTVHVSDPSPGNNTRSTQLPVTVVGPCGTVATVRIGGGTSGTCTPGGDCTVPLDALDVQAPGLGAFTVDIVYDDSLAPTAWDKTGSPMDMVNCNLDFAPYTVRCTGISAAGQQGNVLLANLTFRCAAGMLPGECDPLHVDVVTFAYPNGETIPNQGEDGEICAINRCPCGDVNGSDGPNPVDSVDCLFILQNVVGQKQCSSQCPPPAGQLNCPAANIDSQDGITSIDALFCLQYVVGIRPPPLTCAPLP